MSDGSPCLDKLGPIRGNLKERSEKRQSDGPACLDKAVLAQGGGGVAPPSGDKTAVRGLECSAGTRGLIRLNHGLEVYPNTPMKWGSMGKNEEIGTPVPADENAGLQGVWVTGEVLLYRNICIISCICLHALFMHKPKH